MRTSDTRPVQDTGAWPGNAEDAEKSNGQDDPDRPEIRGQPEAEPAKRERDPPFKM